MTSVHSVAVQQEPFDSAAEGARLKQTGGEAGALVTFTGIVRGRPGSSLTLQHYPGMTERQMDAIAAQASERFALLGCHVIHRYGRLLPGEEIVFVGVSSAHRGEAFRAAEFLIDWLKTRAPFWKKEEDPSGTSRWVEARDADDAAAARWD